MTDNAQNRDGNTSPEDEQFVVFITVMIIGSLLLGSVGVLWLRGSGWLVAHQILVSASHHPRLVLPGTHGAGLDLRRLVLLAAACVGALALVIDSARRRYRRSQDRA